MKYLIFLLFLISVNISYGQELGILLKSQEESLEILKERFPDETPRLSSIDGDTALILALNTEYFFIFKYRNGFCYHEEFRTRDMSFNIDSVNLRLSKKLPKDEYGNYYYDIGKYRFYYQVLIYDNLYKSIKTIRVYGTD